MDKQLHFNALISSDIGGHVRNRFSSFEERGLNRNTSALIVSLQLWRIASSEMGTLLPELKSPSISRAISAIFLPCGPSS